MLPGVSMTDCWRLRRAGGWSGAGWRVHNVRMRIVIPGGSGFIGRALSAFLVERGHSVTVLTRRPERPEDVAWDGRTLGDWAGALEGADAVVNLTGRSVSCLYTPTNRAEILNSRLDAVRAIDQAVLACATPPPAVVQAASLHIYGDTTAACNEDAPLGEGFSEEVCKRWEAAFFEQQLPGARKVLLRIGFVLGPNGGALATMRTTVQWFLGGTVGNGGQYISWLHVHDLCRLFLRCIEDPDMQGIYNATGPTPVTNRVFMHALRRVLHRPWSPPAPPLLVNLGARYLFRTEGLLALTGRRCYPARLQAAGFGFEHPDLDEALADVMSRWRG